MMIVFQLGAAAITFSDLFVRPICCNENATGSIKAVFYGIWISMMLDHTVFLNNGVGRALQNDASIGIRMIIIGVINNIVTNQPTLITSSSHAKTYATVAVDNDIANYLIITTVIP